MADSSADESRSCSGFANAMHHRDAKHRELGLDPSVFRRPPQLSPFPGLSSHPPFSPDPLQRDSPSPSIRQFPEFDSSYEANHRPLGPTISSKPYPIDPYAGTAADVNMAVGNFSRPRKPSVRQANKDLPQSRQRTITIPQPDPTGLDLPSSNNVSPNPSIQQTGWPRGRGLSASSARSTNTFSSLPHRPSNDHINSAYRAGSLRLPNPSTNLARPPVSFNNGNGSMHSREAPPWVATGNDELRSSFRSQLTSSTTQGTLFTATGTERSSVLTKTSSLTESSMLNGYAPAGTSVDEGLSVEDVMGMYEQGFGDDSDDGEDDPGLGRRKFGDDENDTREIDVGVSYDESRPETGNSESSRIGNKTLDAMSDTSRVDGALDISNSNSNWGRFDARDSPRGFRSPGFPSSLPKDVGFALATAALGGGGQESGNLESAAKGNHDLARTLGGDDQPIVPQLGSGESTAPSMHPQPPSPTANTPVQPSASRSPTSSPPYQVPEEPVEDPADRDRYGFRKANAYITREQYDTWDSSYSDYLARRRKKWVAYLKDSSLMTENPNRFPPRNAKTKRFIRKGVPPDWRGAAWFYYAGGPAILAKHGGVYDQLVRRAGLEARGKGGAQWEKSELKQLIIEDIEKDLHRTFPDNTKFKPARYAKPPQEPPLSMANSEAALTNPSPDQASTADGPRETEIISSLRRVLYAFALYNPRIGYCQSLNFLAGLLLLFVDGEEQAFWLLNVITRVYLPGTHEMSLEGSKIDLAVFMAALQDALPSVWKQIAGDEAEGMGKPTWKTRGKRAKGVASASASPGGGNDSSPVDPNRLPSITLCMTAWFMSCFIGTLPMETVLRVWDIFFYEGSRTLFRVALTIFKVGESEIKSVADPMEMFGVVQSLPRRLLDCNALMEACYKRRNGIGHLSQEAVDERRQERRAGIRTWRAEQERASASPTQDPDPLGAGAAAAGLDLAAHFADIDVRRKGTLFGRRKDREKARAAEVM
ncbi:RabGAP/TBC [Phialemonium atrogriseum]|uniref:RabGAP/TBC n=1 Tax=Phialemonium atrogriseum TaxID=1093897 RepID=A0AAJ0FKY7_9PEZI|nr:RabGAP/TBC [Phialemonium atrogriseum]KAK1771597.1 RabGAP/TBC [Phialemonium atrogriseum]